MVSPSKSLVVVINGPEASAGLNPKRFNTRGVTVPTNEANTTTLKSATDTTKDNLFSENNNTFAPKTISARKSPLSKATENTLVNRDHNPSSTKPGFDKLCTINDDD